MSRTLVMGAELLCTKSQDSKEVSILMASADYINNAMIHGRQTANRRNREERKDIIPFTKCKKTTGLLGLSGHETCDDTIVTAPLWENLTLPFDEIKVPHISLVVQYKTPSTFWEALFGSRYRFVDVVGNLNNSADEAQFRSNYEDAKKNKKQSSGYEFSDQELRRNANLKIYANSSASDYASLNVDSILLCTGYGGIIHPKTDGQLPVYGKQLFELALSLPSWQITEKVYAELSRLFLYELEDNQKSTFISLCFDFNYRSDPSFIESMVSGTVQRADVWKANDEKYSKLLGYMNIYASLEYAALKDLNIASNFERQQYLNTLHKMLLFDSAQYIGKPASEIGASGPYISLGAKTEIIGDNYNYRGEIFNWEINSYVLGYKKYELFDIESLNDPFLLQALNSFSQVPNPYSPGSYNPRGYEMFSKEVSVFCPAEGSAGLTALMNLLNDKSYNALAPSPYSGVPGAVRDEAIALAVDISGGAISTLASHGIGLVTAGYDILADIDEARKQAQTIGQIRDLNNFITVCGTKNWVGGVAVYSDPGIKPTIRDYPSTLK